jgi:hypothetical protein
MLENVIDLPLVQRREVSLEILNYKKNGDKFWNLLSMMPVHDAEGNLVSFIGVQSDITELIRRKYAERELQQAKVGTTTPLHCMTQRCAWKCPQSVLLSFEAIFSLFLEVAASCR